MRFRNGQECSPNGHRHPQLRERRSFRHATNPNLGGCATQVVVTVVCLLRLKVDRPCDVIKRDLFVVSSGRFFGVDVSGAHIDEYGLTMMLTMMPFRRRSVASQGFRWTAVIRSFLLVPLLLCLVLVNPSACTAETTRNRNTTPTTKEAASTKTESNPAMNEELVFGPLLPWPKRVEVTVPSSSSNDNGDPFVLTVIDPKNFDVVLAGADASAVAGVGDSINDAPEYKSVVDFMERAKRPYLDHHFFALPDHPNEYIPNPDGATLLPADSLHVTVMTNTTTLQHGVDESYTVTNHPSDGPTAVASTVFGALRAIETVCQLIRFGWLDKETGEPVFVIPQRINITDAPVYPYRGLMIDTSRHYLPIDLIVKNLDSMAMNKLNVLHWHMVDSQSWPFVSTTYPELSMQGAYDPVYAVYTHKDVKRVVEEAYYRGIRVIPEFDMPGHTQAIGASHPELLSPCSPEEYSEPLNPTEPAVYDFVERLYKEIVELFWTADMVHVGGDEVSPDCWENSKSINEWRIQHNISDSTGLYEYFETKLLDIVSTKLQKRTVVWQEVFDLGLPIHPDTIVDVWKDWGNQDVDTLEKATAAGYHVILSSCWYLNQLTTTWQGYYNCEPREFFNGTKAQKDLVVGGHACMWGEMVDAANFETRVWPRASSAAERLWSGTNGESSILDRMPAFRCDMVRRGVPAGPTGPGTYCDSSTAEWPGIKQMKNGEGTGNLEEKVQ